MVHCVILSFLGFCRIKNRLQRIGLPRTDLATCSIKMIACLVYLRTVCPGSKGIERVVHGGISDSIDNVTAEA